MTSLADLGPFPYRAQDPLRRKTRGQGRKCAEGGEQEETANEGREALVLLLFFLKGLCAVSQEALCGISIFHQSPDYVPLYKTILAFLVLLPF